MYNYLPRLHFYGSKKIAFLNYVLINVIFFIARSALSGVKYIDVCACLYLDHTSQGPPFNRHGCVHNDRF